VAEPAARPGRPGAVHRRDQREDPATGRWLAGRLTSRSRPPATAGATSWGLGRRRRGGCEVLLHMLTEIKNRGVGDVCIVVCDGLSGLPDAVTTTWPQAITQTSNVHNPSRGCSPWSPAPTRVRPMQTRHPSVAVGGLPDHHYPLGPRRPSRHR
jgi:hypothetical protein